MNFKLWTAVAVCLFGIGIALGLTVRGSMSDFITRDVAALQQLSADLGPFKITTAAFIFVKNVSTLVLSFAFSPLLWSLPVIALTLNGWLLSYVTVLAVQQKSIVFVLAAILPHGIIEIPALMIGEAAALSFGTAALAALFSDERRRRLLPNLRQNLRYLAFATILLAPAAIIETYVTPLFLR